MQKTDKLKAMREGGQILAKILEEIKDRVEPGTQTKQIDDWARRFCLKYNVRPSFLNYEGYPAAICVSLNDEVVHGIPSSKIIQEGDVVSLDFGVYHKGYHTDAAISFGVGTITNVAARLIDVTRESLKLGIAQVKPGNHIGDIGAAIQKYAESEGFGVVRTLVGHGVGDYIHEDPLIPNFGLPGEGPEIKEGDFYAIEPMVTGGNYAVFLDRDGWTYKTKDCSLAAHFEHTIYVSKNGAEILTKI